MTVITRTRDELRAVLAPATRPIGLVPTMGGLHDGHRSLMARARSENATTVAWIFVNPRQFDDANDLDRYPHDVEADLRVCEEEGVDIVWLPSVDDVYPEGFDTTIHVGAITERLEGAARPGHFDGVATVVATIFGLMRADRAYFGQKDAQQIRVIERMVEDLSLPTRVVPCPTVREPDGLALSSRNVLLDARQRAAAAVLYRALQGARDRWRQGERDAATLRAVMHDVIAAEPAGAIDYVSVADTADLHELERVDGAALLSVAVTFGDTRLIDNMTIEPEEDT